CRRRDGRCDRLDRRALGVAEVEGDLPLVARAGPLDAADEVGHMAAALHSVEAAGIGERAGTEGSQQAIEVAPLSRTERHRRTYDDEPAVTRLREPRPVDRLGHDLR